MGSHFTVVRQAKSPWLTAVLRLLPCLLIAVLFLDYGGWLSLLTSAPASGTLSHMKERRTQGSDSHHHAMPPTPMPRVAIGFRSSVVWLERWRNLLHAMATRDDIILFASVWDKEPDEALLSAWMKEPRSTLGSIKFEPGGSVTPGRNRIFQSIYEEEVRRGKRFETWVVCDSDAAFLECYRCPVTRLPNVTGSACCMDYFIRLALDRAYNFSTISTLLAWDEVAPFEAKKDLDVVDRMFHFRDCADAQLQAIHRDLVPVVFPYHEELEEMSIWSSQGMLFRYTSTCAPGANVLPGRNLRQNEQEHVAYNRGRRDQNAEAEIVRLAFPELAEWPINEVASPTLMCLRNQRGVVTLDPSSSHPDVVDWRATEAFRKCLRIKEPWFVQTTGKGVPQAPR